MNRSIILNEIVFKAVRSSGAGGQHVNKVSSKVLLSFDMKNSNGLTVAEKTMLFSKLASKLTKDNILLVAAEESRSQFRNKAIATTKLLEIIKEGLTKPVTRKATKPTRGSVKRRVEQKKRDSEKKSRRRKPPREE